MNKLATALVSFQRSPFTFGSLIHYVTGDNRPAVGIMVEAVTQMWVGDDVLYTYRVTDGYAVTEIESNRIITAFAASVVTVEAALQFVERGIFDGFRTLDLPFVNLVDLWPIDLQPGDVFIAGDTQEQARVHFGIVYRTEGDQVFYSQGCDEGVLDGSTIQEFYRVVAVPGTLARIVH